MAKDSKKRPKDIHVKHDLILAELLGAKNINNWIYTILYAAMKYIVGLKEEGDIVLEVIILTCPLGSYKKKEKETIEKCLIILDEIRDLT